MSEIMPFASMQGRRDRQLSRELAAIYQQTDTSDAMVAGIAQVTQTGLVTLMQTSAIRRALEHMYPDSAELAAMLVVAATVKQTQEISRMGLRRGCGR